MSDTVHSVKCLMELFLSSSLSERLSLHLTIAYMHRKQMLQNKLFRIDPSKGLRPPPSAFTTFLKRRGLTVVTRAEYES